MSKRVNTGATEGRERDIIVYGSSGFTGALVTRYIHSNRGNLKIAVAGRNEGKMRASLDDAGIHDLDVVVADSSDEDALRRMVQSTKVVISLVGPYSLYGSLLVKLCVENNTHLVDLTGEAHWAARMISQHGQDALANKTLVVHSCGFDSIPSDLCTFLAVRRLQQLTSSGVGKVKSLFSVKGGASGGTIASGLAFMNASIEERNVAMDGFCLSPLPANHKLSPVIAGSSTFRGKTAHGSFFFMAPHNEAIVRRSWGLLEGTAERYGPNFQYSELFATGGLISAAMTSLAIYAIGAALMFISPLRHLVSRYGPQPGEGPSLEDQKNGWFKTVTTATSEDGRHQVQVIMRGKGDPGYSGTAKMISECALAIANDYDRLPALARDGGFLTPSTAFGDILVKRLEATGTFSFETNDGKEE